MSHLKGRKHRDSLLANGLTEEQVLHNRKTLKIKYKGICYSMYYV